MTVQLHGTQNKRSHSYHQLSQQNVLQHFSSNLDEGLSPEEVARRYEK